MQTAVIGDEHSDAPVVLPIEAIELDVFRHMHAHDTFWCGMLLGGCGAQLAHKLYIDRQCHFQHYPQPDGAPHACRRPRVGESSADHLYVKSAMSRSLLEHGRSGQFAFPPPIGSLLDVDLEDGHSLRVHMDSSVPPDWADGRTVVLGPGVVLDPGVLSGCPYVYRVRCESDGADRRVWIGTQSLGRPTEWVPIDDCAWTRDGLITPAATEILQQRPAATGPIPAEAARRSGTLPESVTRFIRGLEAAQRSGTVEHVRRLCASSGPFLTTLDAAARAEAKQSLEEARTWLTAHEDYQQRVFADLAKAVTEKRAFDVRSQLQQAAALTRRGVSTSEQRVLAAARAFLREQDHVGHTESDRPTAPTRWAWTVPTKKRRTAPRAERTQPAKTRDAAAAEVRTTLKRLRREGNTLRKAELRTLTQKLSQAAARAGTTIRPADHEAVAKWAHKAKGTMRAAKPDTRSAPHAAKDEPTRTRPAPRPARTQLPPDVLASAAAAVRGALKKAAREQTTTTWARLKQQLGSALPHMAIADRIQVLTLVDQATPADQALLSSLVAAGDPDMMTSYRKVADALGLDVPVDDDDLRDVLEADVQQVHHHWRHQ
ncbi:hypothetical protein [Streptomyces sp. NBC_00696]|uniref:hypothetical protein n=1 Tax=Streptomyces sp. NBC_00696 TaxID=2903672 RepID=UPI002E31E990|nr:hypothetical protein [Streptomyces sp. NBC_00696]